LQLGVFLDRQQFVSRAGIRGLPKAGVHPNEESLLPLDAGSAWIASFSSGSAERNHSISVGFRPAPWFSQGARFVPASTCPERGRLKHQPFRKRRRVPSPPGTCTLPDVFCARLAVSRSQNPSLSAKQQAY